MSVVNKMLSDLETRKQNAAAQADYIPPSSDKWRVVRIGLVVLTLVGIAAAIYWQMTRTIQYVSGSETGSETISSAGVADDALPDSGGRGLTPDGATLLTPATKGQVLSSTNSGVSAESDSTSEATSDTRTAVEQPLFTEVTELTDDSEVTEATEPAMDDVMETRSPSTPVEGNDDMLIAEPSDEADTSLADEKPESELVIAPSDLRAGTDISALKQEARLALNANENDRAISLLHEILKQEPTNVAARKQLAALLFATGLVSNAQAVLADGIDINPENREFRLMLARLFMQQSAFERGYQTLAPLSVDVFMHSDYISLRASLAEKSGQYDAARRDYQQLIAAHPENATWWLGLAVTLERLEQYDNARQAYQRALSSQQLGSDINNFIETRLRFLAGKA